MGEHSLRLRMLFAAPVFLAMLLQAAFAQQMGDRPTLSAGPRRPLPGESEKAGLLKAPPPLLRSAVEKVMAGNIASSASKSGISVAVMSPAAPRYGDGAPVVVRVLPPMRPNPLVHLDELGLTALGFAVVEMSYPSGDEFDQGGPNCKRAVADVFKFAMGQKTDDRGRGIGQYCSAPVLTNVVGAVGMSHGGNAIVTTLEEFGEELSGLAFYVSYESPCGTSKDALGDIVLIDYGGVAGDPDPRTDADNNGFPWDDGRSPFYTPAKGLDLARLRWDREASFSSPMMPLQGSGILFLDGNANGKFNVVEEAKNASQPWAFPPIPAPTDTNRNGAVDANEDFELRFHTYRFGGETKRVYSLSVARAAASTVFRSGFPRDIATVEETGEYWRHRDMAAAFDRLGGQFAQLLACIFAGRQDHVQAQWDYPHIRAQYEGLRHAGIGWVRLNPDPVYVRAIADFGNMYLPNNPPNAALSADTMWERTEPVRGPLGAVFVAAAVCELADRVKANNRQHPLESVLFANAPKAAALAPSELLAPEMLKK